MNRIAIASLVASAMLAGALPAQAVLAPNYQRAAEMQAILADSNIMEAFGPYRPIELIKSIGDDRYLLTGGECSMRVAISDVAGEPGRVGARQFAVKPGELSCD